MRVCWLLALLCFRCATALDTNVLEDYDLEVQDDASIEDELNAEMATISDEDMAGARLDTTSSDAEDVLLDSALSEVDQLEQLLHKQLNDEEGEVNNREQKEDDMDLEDVDQSDGEPEDFGGLHFMKKRSLRDFYLENAMRRFLLGPHGHSSHDNFPPDMQTAPPRTNCSSFVKPTKHSKSTCGVTNTTMLGSIHWCHVTCSKGYKLKLTFPQYELCGNATKFRWTYELRGLTKGSERCIKKGAKVATKKKKTSKSTAASVACTTPQCFASAAYYMNKIDFKVNPCDDFYEFACGRWLKETPIPPSKSKFLTYTTIRDRVARNMADLLNKPYVKTECEAVKKAKIVYKACINTELIDELDANPLHMLLKDELEWPIISPDWDPTDFFLEKTLATLRGRFNNQVLFKTVVRKTNGNHVLQTWKGKLALPFAYYKEPRYEKKLDAYYDLLYDVAMMMGGNHDRVNSDIGDLRQFERKLADYKLDDWDYFSPLTINQLQFQVPNINWLYLFKTMIHSHPITKSTKIQVWNVNYLNDLINLIQRTKKRTVQNYMIWRFVKHRVRNLSNRFSQAYLRYEEKMLGKESLPPRWDKCATHLLYLMKGATGKLFIDKYFSAAKKKAAKELFNFIRKGFLHLLDSEVTWMDNKTRAYAKRKALAITSDIGYNPAIYKNTTYLDLEVKHLEVRTWDYFGNTLNLLTTISQNKFKLLGEPYNTTVDMFTQRPTMVNAFYSPTRNRITLPAGEMQYPFYWGDKFPRMFQFGGIGTILGHELTHGFDNTGRQYDLKGNLNNWWTTTSLMQFKKRTTCMEDQYSNYYFAKAGEHLKGVKTLGENIADNGGIRESFEGYHLWLKARGLKGEQVEPTTGLTNDQMFFVGFANVRCGKFTHRGAVHEVAKDVHSPGRFRVIGSLQNFDKFSTTFNCPADSKMNPKTKCVIW